jgi:hypothetical protein
MATAKERAEAKLAAIRAREERIRLARQKARGEIAAMVKKEEKRRVWKVGEAAMAAMAWSGAVRDAVAKELGKEGVLRRQNDPEAFADLLAGTYVPTREEIAERRERSEAEATNADAPAAGPGIAVAAQ